MIGKFIFHKKKLIAGLMSAYLAFFGGLLLYVKKTTSNVTPLENVIQTVELIKKTPFFVKNVNA